MKKKEQKVNAKEAMKCGKREGGIYICVYVIVTGTACLACKLRWLRGMARACGVCVASLFIPGHVLRVHFPSLSSLSHTQSHAHTHSHSLTHTTIIHTAPRTICFSTQHQASHASPFASSTSRLPACKSNALSSSSPHSTHARLHHNTYIRHRALVPQAPIPHCGPLQHTHSLTHIHTHICTGD